MNVTIYIGDYGVNIWVPKGQDEKEVIQKVINNSIGYLGLKVVKA
jgi:hypothetical protein